MRLYERHVKETGSIISMNNLGEILQDETWGYPIDLERAAALYQHAAFVHFTPPSLETE